MSGQIVDATLVAAPRQRNTDAEKAAIKAGRSAAEIWPEIDIAIPTFGYKSHIVGFHQDRLSFLAFGLSDLGRHGDRDQARLDGEHPIFSAISAYTGPRGPDEPHPIGS